MRKILLGAIIAIAILLVYKYCVPQNNITIKENSALIQESIKNVGKLVVTEGHFSEAFSYENSKALLGNYFKSQKTALVIVNADVTVAYDLSKIKYDLDEENKILKITSIPEEEIKISPDLEYYDVESGYFNAFDEKDYNIIKETVNKRLSKKIENSQLKTNAKNRLVSELSKFYILTNSLGWTLQYNETKIENTLELDGLKL